MIRIVSPGESRGWGGRLLNIVEINSVSRSYQALLKQDYVISYHHRVISLQDDFYA
jgi:hypothetical protein